MVSLRRHSAAKIVRAAVEGSSVLNLVTTKVSNIEIQLLDVRQSFAWLIHKSEEGNTQDLERQSNNGSPEMTDKAITEGLEKTLKTNIN